MMIEEGPFGAFHTCPSCHGAGTVTQEVADALQSPDYQCRAHQCRRQAVEMRERISELEVACAQAAEFAQYVEDAAKGAMAERARHYLSLPYSQELAARLDAARQEGEDNG